MVDPELCIIIFGKFVQICCASIIRLYEDIFILFFSDFVAILMKLYPEVGTEYEYICFLMMCPMSSACIKLLNFLYFGQGYHII